MLLCVGRKQKRPNVFLTFWTYAVRKLLMSRRVDGNLCVAKGILLFFDKQGINPEGKVVIENEVNFYGHTVDIDKNERWN